jgi:uncharacterized protein YbcV (DUF1398 family)
MNKSVISDCMRLSFADVPFPQVVAKLVSAGVRSYRADLVRLSNCYSDGAQELYDSALPLTDPPAIGGEFRESDVADAVKAIQRGEVGYADFLRRIMRAGCASYSVFIAGRKAIYFGRDGDFHVEMFPDSK